MAKTALPANQWILVLNNVTTGLISFQHFDPTAPESVPRAWNGQTVSKPLILYTALATGAAAPLDNDEAIVCEAVQLLVQSPEALDVYVKSVNRDTFAIH